MQAAGTDVSRTCLVVSRQCIAHGTNLVYTAGCLMGCFHRLSGDAERKRSFVGVESEKERRSPVVRAFRSCYDRILFDSKLLLFDVIFKACHRDTLNLDIYILRSARYYAGTLDIEANDNDVSGVGDNEISDVRGVIS